MSHSPFPDPEGARRLLADLRPSPHVEAELRVGFRGYHRLRRLRTWITSASLAAATCVIVLLMRPAAPPEALAAEFYPLPGVTITPAMLASSQIVRVELNGTTLAQLGLAAQAGPVEAELVLTQDGLPRAIRLLP